VEFAIPAPGAGSHAIFLQVDDPKSRPGQSFLGENECLGQAAGGGGRGDGSGRPFPRDFPERGIECLLGFAVHPESSVTRSLNRKTLLRPHLSSGTTLRCRAAAEVEVGGIREGWRGMAIVVPDSSSGPVFNRLFGSWLPAKVETDAGGNATRSRPPEDYRLLANLRMDHPIFLPFREPRSGSFSGVRFFSTPVFLSAMGQMCWPF